MKKYLLDTSVLLDLFLNRLPWAADMAVIWEAHRQGQIKALVTAFAVPTIFYIVRRQASLTTAQTVVQACLSTLDVAPVERPARSLPNLWPERILRSGGPRTDKYRAGVRRRGTR